jgi:hypothetical protein
LRVACAIRALPTTAPKPGHCSNSAGSRKKPGLHETVKDYPTEVMLSFEKSAAFYEQAMRSVAGGVNSNVRYGESPPLFFERGEGPRLHDVDGNVLIDFVLGNGPAILGHAAPSVIGPVAASLGAGQSIAGQHRGEIELAEHLKRIIPSAELVRFSVSGSEAVHDPGRPGKGHPADPHLPQRRQPRVRRDVLVVPSALERKARQVLLNAFRVL